MIKAYQGSGVYEITLTSGTDLTLTEDELSELSGGVSDELEMQIKDLEADNQQYENANDYLQKKISELSNEINFLRDKYDVSADEKIPHDYEI